jgi:hypothetical protein
VKFRKPNLQFVDLSEREATHGVWLGRLSLHVIYENRRKKDGQDGGRGGSGISKGCHQLNIVYL